MGLIKKIKETFVGKKEGNKPAEQQERQEPEKIITEQHKAKDTPTIRPETKQAMESDATKKPIVETLKTIEDPELGIDIWTLGLIYNIEPKDKGVTIRMTFTSIMCPVGPMIVESVKTRIKQENNMHNVHVEVTFDPVWEPTEELRELLGV